MNAPNNGFKFPCARCKEMVPVDYTSVTLSQYDPKVGPEEVLDDSFYAAETECPNDTHPVKDENDRTLRIEVTAVLASYLVSKGVKLSAGEAAETIKNEGNYIQPGTLEVYEFRPDAPSVFSTAA